MNDLRLNTPYTNLASITVSTPTSTVEEHSFRKFSLILLGDNALLFEVGRKAKSITGSVQIIGEMR